MNQISWPIDLFFLFSGGHFIAGQAVAWVAEMVKKRSKFVCLSASFRSWSPGHYDS